ncbi:hypothetical protein NP493_67g05005 [Ridgeia piscesae]|uniref:Fibrinogen C-terminal domain-containing protein n=1 Tax=Ridgeia piscesae TaxID=27915 RepID=A0AAD9UIU4_RIDPI|nr:hypothetical protein NP493_67g05005 [Ridgeia piscesae]
MTTWEDYRNGFAISSTELWLGNEHVHVMTTAGKTYTLRIELTSYDGERRIAEYEDFELDSEMNNYRLHLGGYMERSDAGYKTEPKDAQSFLYAALP